MGVYKFFAILEDEKSVFILENQLISENDCCLQTAIASVECVERGLYLLRTSLCVMSRADNSNGLILASSPMFKKVCGKSNVGRSYGLPFDIYTRKFSSHYVKQVNIELILREVAEQVAIRLRELIKSVVQFTTP